MAICGNAPFLHTAFMQSTVVSFSVNMGWGLQHGNLKVHLVDGEPASGNSLEEHAQWGYNTFGVFDTRCGSFTPGPIGSPCKFDYNGFIAHGLIQGWEESVSISGRTYEVTLETPHVILSGCKMILKSLDDYDPTPTGTPRGKFVNLHLETTPRPFQSNTYFSFCNEVGVTWQDIYDVMHLNWVFAHKGYTYQLDLSELNLLGGTSSNYKFGGESMDVLSCVEKFARAMCKRAYLTLIPKGDAGGAHNIIKVRTHDQGAPVNVATMNDASVPIAARLASGSAYALLSVKTVRCLPVIPTTGLNTVVKSQRYGLEAADVVTDCLIIGDNWRHMYEIADEDGKCAEGGSGALCISGNPNGLLGVGSAQIRHYWGDQADSNGNMVPITSYGCGDDEIFYVDVSAQVFFRTIQGVTIPFAPCLTNNRYYPVTVLEIRAAGNSFESWFEYMCEFKLNCLIEFFNPSNTTELGRFDINAIWDIILADTTPGQQRTHGGPNDAVDTNADLAAAHDALERDRRNAAGTEGLRALHAFVKKFASHYGQKFAIPLPSSLIACCSGGINPELIPGLERSDFGWAWVDGSIAGGPGADTILGLPWNSIPLEIFKNDEGACKPMFYYENIKFEADNEGSRGQSRNVGVDFAKITVPWFVQPMFTCSNVSESASSEGAQGFSGDIASPDSEHSSPSGPSLAAPAREEKTDSPGFRLWLQSRVEKIHDPCDLLGNGPVAVMSTPAPVFLRPVDTAGNRTSNQNALWEIILSHRLDRELTDKEKEALNKAIATPGGAGMRGMGLIPKAHMPAAAAIAFKDNKRTYPGPAKWHDSTGSDGRAEFEKNTELAPWKFGNQNAMNNAGMVIVTSMTSNQPTVESGSVEYAGTPLQASAAGMGGLVGGGGATITGLTLSVGMQGVTTTVAFRTWLKNWGDWGKNQADYIAAQGRSTQQLQRAYNLRIARTLQEDMREAFIDVLGDNDTAGGGDSSSAGPNALTLGTFNNAVESDFILGFNWALSQDETYPDRVESVGNYSAFEPLRNAITLLGASAANQEKQDQKDYEYRIRGGMSLDGLIRPYQFVDLYGHVTGEGSTGAGVYNKINPVMAPYKLVDQKTVGTFPDTGWCAAESYGQGHWPNWGINSYTLCPFITGHDIKRGLFGKEYPKAGIELYEGKSAAGGFGPLDVPHLRPYALKGPLVMVGWGYDIDGYPVPNNKQPDELAAGDYKPEDRTFFFKDNWLTRQDQWKAGPIDLRWDEKRGVWCPRPANKFKIIPFKLIGEWVYEYEFSNYKEGETKSTYVGGGFVDSKEEGTGYKVYTALATSEPACVADVCCIGPVIEGYGPTPSAVCADDKYDNVDHNHKSKKAEDHTKDFLSDWTGYPEKYAPCDSVPAEEFCANNDSVVFKVWDNLDLYADFGPGDLGFAYRDFDCDSAFTIIEMAPTGGDRCLIRETTEFISEEDDPCDLRWRIGKASYQLNMGDPYADEDREDIQTEAPIGTEGCMPCTLEETFWIDTDGFLTMEEYKQCYIISENARYDHNFDVHKKQYLGHVPTLGADSFSEDSEPLDEDGQVIVNPDLKKGPCVKWMDAEDDCLIPELPSLEGPSSGPAELTLGQRGVAPGWGGMACTLENTYKFTETPDLTPGGDNLFDGWTIAQPVSPNAIYDHNFNPNKKQVLTHKKILWKRVLGGIDGVNDDLVPEAPIVWWDDVTECDIAETTTKDDGIITHGEAAPYDKAAFPCTLEKTYHWRPQDKGFPGANSNWTTEQGDFPDNFWIDKDTDTADLPEKGLFEVSRNATVWDYNFQPVWRQVLHHTPYLLDPSSASDNLIGSLPQVKWVAEFYAGIPWQTVEKYVPAGTDEFHHKYYDTQDLTKGESGVPGTRPDYQAEKDKDKLRFGQEVFPTMLSQTYTRNTTPSLPNDQSDYLGEGFKYWGMPDDNDYGFDYTKLQVLAHFATATEDYDSSVQTLDDASTDTPASNSNDFEVNNGPMIRWLDYEGCQLPKITKANEDTSSAHPYIFGQNCLPCKLEQTIGYTVADHSGTYNAGYNATGLGSKMLDFGFDPTKKQFLGHVPEGGEDFIKSGDDTDFDPQEGPCIEWFADKECDIPLVTEEGEHEPSEEPGGGVLQWNFGQDCFPCTLADTYRLDEGGPTQYTAGPTDKWYGVSEPTLDSDRWYSDESGYEQNPEISENASLNSFNFRPDVVQFLGHIPNLAESCEEPEEGPCIKWMSPYICGIPMEGMARNDYNPCLASEDWMHGVDDYPCHLEDTFFQHSHYSAMNGADKLIEDVYTGLVSKNMRGGGPDYGFKSNSRQQLGHIPLGGHPTLSDSGQVADWPENKHSGPTVRWENSHIQVINDQRGCFPNTIAETLKGSSAQFTKAFLNGLSTFGYDKTKKQTLTHEAATVDQSTGEVQKDDCVRWADAASCLIPVPDANAPASETDLDKSNFPCTLEETYTGSMMDIAQYNGNMQHNFAFNDNNNQFLMHAAKSHPNYNPTGGPNGLGVSQVTWANSCCIEPGVVGGTAFFPCSLHDTYHAGGAANTPNFGGPSYITGSNFKAGHIGDFGYDSNLRQSLSHLGWWESGTLIHGDVFWLNLPQVPRADQGDFPQYLADMYGGAPVPWALGGRENPPGVRGGAGGTRPKTDAAGGDRNWNGSKWQAIAHKPDYISGAGAQTPSIEWKEFLLCNIDSRTYIGDGTTECFPCTLQDTYKNAGVIWINNETDANLHNFNFDPAIEQVLSHEANDGGGPCIKWKESGDACQIPEASRDCWPCTLEETYQGSELPGVGSNTNITSNFGYDTSRMQMLAHTTFEGGRPDGDCVGWVGYHVLEKEGEQKFPCYFWELLGESGATFDNTDYNWEAEAGSYSYDSGEVQVLGHTKAGDSASDGAEQIKWMTVKDCDEEEEDNGNESPSDERLKEDIELVGKSPSGINIYEFTFNKKIHDNFKGYAGLKFRGALYQELKKTHPDCVKRDPYSGYGMILYNKIDVDFEEIED